LVLDYEIMAGWIHQKLDWDGGAGLVSSGKDCWRDSTSAKITEIQQFTPLA